MALFSWMEFVAVLTSVGCLIYEQMSGSKTKPCQIGKYILQI